MKKLLAIVVGLAVIAVAAVVMPVEKPSAIGYGSVLTTGHQTWAVKEEPARSQFVEQVAPRSQFVEMVNPDLREAIEHAAKVATPVHALAVTQWNGVRKRITG